MDREAWQATAHEGRKESDTTERLHFTSLHEGFVFMSDAKAQMGEGLRAGKAEMKKETGFLSMKESESEVTQSCPTLCDPMDCSPLGSSIHGIF